MSAARKAAEAFIAVGHVWDGPTCIRAVEIITSLLAEQPEAGADPVRRFGLSVLAAWWDEGNPGDLGGDDLHDFAEHVGLWHRVERHAEGVECEWCQNDGSGCGELTEAGDRAVREANDLPLRPATSPASDEQPEEGAYCPSCGGNGWTPEGDEQLGCVACNGTGHALLAPPPAPSFGSTSTVRSDSTPAQPLPTCVNCGSNFIAPPPAPEAPRPKDDIWDACGCPNPDDCEHVFYEPAPSAAVREAAERLWHSLTPPRSTTDDGMLLVRAEDVEAVLRWLAARGGE